VILLTAATKEELDDLFEVYSEGVKCIEYEFLTHVAKGGDRDINNYKPKDSEFEKNKIVFWIFVQIINEIDRRKCLGGEFKDDNWESLYNEEDEKE